MSKALILVIVLSSIPSSLLFAAQQSVASAATATTTSTTPVVQGLNSMLQENTDDLLRGSVQRIRRWSTDRKVPYRVFAGELWTILEVRRYGPQAVPFEAIGTSVKELRALLTRRRKLWKEKALIQDQHIDYYLSLEK